MQQICPLASVDRRLADALRLWNAAREAYFDPDLFRTNAQSAIQALRSVTWILQKEKAKLSNFDTWYGARQTAMKANPVLRWLVDARNRIEKQGDLETQSTVRTTIYSGWLDSKVVDTKLPPSYTSATLAKTLGKNLGKRGYEDGTVIRIERRWVDSELPDFEILDALVRAYEFLQILVFEAHGLLSAPVAGVCTLHDQLASSNFVLPAEMLHPFARHQWLDARAGIPINIDYSQRGSTKAELIEQAAERYEPEPDTPKSNRFRDECVYFFSRGRAILQADGFHISTALIDRGAQSQIVQFTPRTRAEKHAYMRDIAEFCLRINANSVMLIGEIWTATFPVGAPQKFLHAVDAPERGEALALTALNRAGQCIEITAPFTRMDGKIVFGPDEVHESRWPNMLAPFREAFGIAPNLSVPVGAAAPPSA
ncbi:MAG: hypothetical protein ACREH8_23065 [Opitutaceae bacterium]